MTQEQFEALLDKAAARLNQDVQNPEFHPPDKFEQRVREVLKDVAEGENLGINPTFHPYAFPDIRANGFGVEVKTVNKDSWLSVGNSIFEGMRDNSVKNIYIIFGKMGGMPGVRWGRYEDRITHVRISHAPRFVVEMDRDSSLFGKLKISYDDFAKLSPEDKMNYVRKYSRARLKKGERLWWLEDENSAGIPLTIKLYMSLSNAEKKKLRAEAALMCPQICGGSRQKDKYNDVALFMLRHRFVFCPQTRDLFTAGSVAGKELGGHYLSRSLKNIETEMRQAALKLDGALLVEYWGKDYPPEQRIAQWLKRADSFATDWTPSKVLFTDKAEKELFG